MPKVYNKNKQLVPKDAVYIGRPSKWGNPFRIGPNGTREEVITKYRKFIYKRFSKAYIKKMLKGKNLVCWCAPKPCHGDVLLEIANE